MTFPGYIRTINNLSNASPVLNDFGIGLRCTATSCCWGISPPPKSYLFFKQLSPTIRPKSLRRLALSHLTTRRKYLATLMRACKDTLKALTLNWVTWRSCDERVLEFLRDELHLNEVVLRCLNSEFEGIYSHHVNYERPQCGTHGVSSRLDDEEWLMVTQKRSPRHEIILKAEEGNDITYWLTQVDEKSGSGDKWTWNDLSWD